MKEIVEFFWQRYHRGNQMGVMFELQAIEWIDAYKNTLSKTKQSEFDKIWNQLEEDLHKFRDGAKGAIAPSMKNIK